VSQSQRPILVYDGDCAFCARSVRLAEQLGTSAHSVPWQFTDLGAVGVTAARAQHEVLWVTPRGHVHGGARAVASLLVDLGGGWRLLGLASRLPPLNWVARALYRLVATNRHRLPGGTDACGLPPRPGPRRRDGSGDPA
jgi:predicted DCC family thiol-disulfide oxidoreductase YuxK